MSTSLTPILPKHIFGDGVDPKVHPRNANPLGSGPFKLVEFKPGEHVIMERFDKFFFKNQPKLDRLIIKEYKDSSSLLLAFEKGEVDCHPQLQDGREQERAKKVAGAQFNKPAAPAIGPLVWLAFNTKNPKLSDKRVRQAINYAIDKNFIINTLLAGAPLRATGPIALGSPFYSKDVEAYNLNIAKANQLLDEAGVKPGANGARLTLDLDALPGPVEFKTMQEFMKPALAKIGIEVNVRISPDFPTWARRVSTAQFDMTLDSVWNWGDPVIGVHRTWLTSNIRSGVIWSNTQSYSNPKVDQLLAQAGQEMDVKKRAAQYKEFQKIVVDEAPVAFIYETVLVEGYTNKVTKVPKGIWGTLDALTEIEMVKV
jgi:peptide/nickel transport system substrate-binding protein